MEKIYVCFIIEDYIDIMVFATKDEAKAKAWVDKFNAKLERLKELCFDYDERGYTIYKSKRWDNICGISHAYYGEVKVR